MYNYQNASGVPAAQHAGWSEILTAVFADPQRDDFLLLLN